jgi:hypothetical protein
VKGHRFRSHYLLSTSRFGGLKTELQWRFLACWTYDRNPVWAGEAARSALSVPECSSGVATAVEMHVERARPADLRSAPS